MNLINRPTLALATGLMLFLAAPATAARPVGDGRYVGYGKSDPIAGSQDVAALEVAADGRGFSSADGGSYLSFDELCAGRAVTSEDDEDLSPSGGHHIRIRRGGRFGLSVKRGAYFLHLRGRFTSRRSARIAVRLREPAEFSRHGRGCRVHEVMRLHYIPKPRFTGCRSQRARTLAEGPTGRIFVQDWKGYETGLVPRLAWGCLYSANRRHALDLHYNLDEPETNYHFRLAGPFTAYIHQSCGGLSCGFAIQVIDLRDGAPVHTIGFSFLLDRPPESGHPYPEDLELKPNGAFAWIASVSTGTDDSSLYEVRVLDGLGLRTVDSGTGIKPRSLVLTGSKLSWMNGSRWRSAALY